MENWKKYLGAVLVFLGLVYTSYWYGKHSVPTDVTVKTEETTKDKTTTAETDKQQTKINTTTHIIKKPDGTEETIITQNQETNTQTSSRSRNSTETTVSSQTEVKTNALSKYRLGVMAESKILNKDERGNLLYSVTTDMRVLGPWWVDAKFGINDKTLGLGISLEF